MGQQYLIDSNIIIGYAAKILPTKSMEMMDSILPSISVISRIELLGWHNATDEQLAKSSNILSRVSIFDLTENIIQKTIAIRQKCKVKTPDAIIAATALVNNFTLITRNESDFKDIEGLQILNL